MNIKSIIDENMPCWYELSFLETENVPSIIFRLHRDFVGYIKEKKIDFNNSFIAKSLKEEFELKDFLSDFDGDIGIGGVLKFLGVKDEFYEFETKVPKIKIDGGKCSSCDGLGERELFNDICPSCKGTGIGYIIDCEKIINFSASYTIMSGFLSGWGKENTSSSKLPQLFSLHTILRRGDHGSSLNGEISIPLKTWIMSSAKRGTEMPEVVSAMRKTYRKMMGPGDYFSIYAYWDDSGHFYTQCPGNACGLCSADFTEKGKGIKFNCHNVDLPEQQFTLIAGLAALHDRARKEIKI